MFRTSIAALFLAAVPVASISAQQQVVTWYGAYGHFNSRGTPPDGSFPPDYMGFRGFPASGVFGGGFPYPRFLAGYYYPFNTGGPYDPGGYYYPYYTRAYYYPEWYAERPLVPVYPEEPRIELSNDFPATLTVQLPSPGNVWANGNKSEGGPTTEWTLTSPVLKGGQEFNFDLIARWTVDGRTFEYNRSIPVAGGNRSKVLVLAGDEVR